MIIIFYGIYRFCQRIVGCRNDFCNACKQRRSPNVGAHSTWGTFSGYHFYHWDGMNAGSASVVEETHVPATPRDAAFTLPASLPSRLLPR